MVRPMIHSRFSLRSLSTSVSISNKSFSGTSMSTLDFQNGELAYGHQSTSELCRAALVFRLCQSPLLVQNSSRFIESAYMVFGERITNTALKQTFFGHFCGGESAQEIKAGCEKLARSGVGSILDYAAEADVKAPRDLNGIPQYQVSARTYDYEGEQECDANADIALQSIEDAASTHGFSAIKLTALGKPELLLRMSSILVDTQRLFHRLDGPSLTKTKKKYLDKLIDFPTLKAGFSNAGTNLSEKEIQSLFDEMDQSQDGHIDYLDWLSFVNPMDLTMGPLTQYFEEGPLSDAEKNQLANMILRLERLAQAAATQKVRLMVDAEQTYMQPAIDHLVLNLQRKYNQKEAVIFNTFQCYLKDSEVRVHIDLERAKREGFQFACKLVRGAYMVQERKRAKDLGYPDPIHDDIESTHVNYNGLVELLLENNDIAEFMVASHNEQSVQHTVQMMEAKNIPKAGGGIYFGQLLGMCDPVSYTLGHHGYHVYKYVPYGPVREVIPYLIRRAEENGGMMAGVSKETHLLSQELKRRLFYALT